MLLRAARALALALVISAAPAQARADASGLLVWATGPEAFPFAQALESAALSSGAVRVVAAASVRVRLESGAEADLGLEVRSLVARARVALVTGDLDAARRHVERLYAMWLDELALPSRHALLRDVLDLDAEVHTRSRDESGARELRALSDALGGAAAPPAAAGSGRVELVGLPPTARVTIDGAERVVEAGSLAVPAGAHVVRVADASMRPWAARFSVAAGAVARLEVVAAPAAEVDRLSAAAAVRWVLFVEAPGDGTVEVSLQRRHGGYMLRGSAPLDSSAERAWPRFAAAIGDADLIVGDREPGSSGGPRVADRSAPSGRALAHVRSRDDDGPSTALMVVVGVVVVSLVVTAAILIGSQDPQPKLVWRRP